MINGHKLIALCTSRIYDPQIYSFIRKLNEILQMHHCTLMIFAINSDIYWEEDLNPAETYVFDLLPYDELDCILIMDEKIKSHTVSRRIIQFADRAEVPVVIVDGRYEGCTSVNFDYEAGFEAITRHVIEEHHVKRPHMMAGIPENEFSDRRIAIFKKVLAENGIEYDEDTMLSYGEFWADPTRAAMEKLVKKENLPDAIVCANDIMAINVADVLKKYGIRVPDDVIVSGFDGYDEVFFTSPKISTASCDTILLAESAAETTLKKIEGKSTENILIVPGLICNESCGCTPGGFNRSNMVAGFNSSFYRHQDDTRILYNISSSMQIGKTAWDMAAAIHNLKTNESLTVVDSNIFNLNSNFFLNEYDEHSKKNFHIIYDADYAEEHLEENLPLPKELFYDDTVNEKESVLSGNYRERIISHLNTGYPLVFNALDYMNRPFGFNCYYFRESLITNYSRAAIVTSAVSMGIGGFINLQYQKKLLERMDEMYRHDALTGLYNRIGFMRIFEEEKKNPENRGKKITLIMSDLDGLKYINDNFGHADGDLSIAAVAKALKEASPEHAICARFGGDELFAVIIGDCNEEAVIRKIDRILEDYNSSRVLPYVVTTSSGAYTSVFDEDYEVLKALKIADDKMYAIKERKRRKHRPE